MATSAATSCRARDSPDSTISLAKKFSLSERVQLQFRAEFFNMLNRANFNTPNPVVFAAADGRPLAHRRRDHLDRHHLPANPVRPEASLVVITLGSPSVRVPVTRE